MADGKYYGWKLWMGNVMANYGGQNDGGQFMEGKLWKRSDGKIWRTIYGGQFIEDNYGS